MGLRSVLLSATAVTVAALVACGTFGEADDASPKDAGGGDDGSTNDGTVPLDDGGTKDGSVPCASKRCFDFESTTQQSGMFGFDSTRTDGDLSLSDGFASMHGLRAKAIGTNDAFGAVKIATLTPQQLHVTLRLRRGPSVKETATSSHFIDVICLGSGGTNASAKIGFVGELSTAIEDKGSGSDTMAAITDAAWVPLDFVLDYGMTSMTATLLRLDDNAAKPATITQAAICTGGIEVRFGSSLYSGQSSFTGSSEVSLDDIRVDWN